MRCNKTAVVSGKRYSINAVAFHGPDLAKHRPGVLPHDMDGDEEEDLTKTIPMRKARPTLWYGRFVVAHLSFYPQAAAVDAADDILVGYSALAPTIL